MVKFNCIHSFIANYNNTRSLQVHSSYWINSNEYKNQISNIARHVRIVLWEYSTSQDISFMFLCEFEWYFLGKFWFHSMNSGCGRWMNANSNNIIFHFILTTWIQSLQPSPVAFDFTIHVLRLCAGHGVHTEGAMKCILIFALHIYAPTRKSLVGTVQLDWPKPVLRHINNKLNWIT